MSIGIDLHALDQMRLLPLGVYVARMDWLERSGVVNTFLVEKFLGFLEQWGGG